MDSRQLDEERIFHTVREIPKPEARKDYLDQICAGDQALRERVEALLEVHEKEQEFLKSTPEPAPTVDHTSLTERPGTTIGRYKLMEQIGEGGMGTVFVAEQERPIRRKVALKVIKPGMDTKAVVARFEAERQALAMMDHPIIAKVLDAGTTESGRPYFAMELVKGIPITEYCDKNKLTIRERLDLFIQVCQAIQHAHQKGIIHRDIKPSNVLVTLHDGKPVPKVIDFGVAKALNTRLTDKTIYTEHLQIVGTLLYMSPEQAELSGLDIDTRSDVYSLGVLLYELLTGTTPFRKAELDQAGFDEQRRIIRETDPPRASHRISSLGETATAVAVHRKSDPRKLQQSVRGDLDWIVVKALEKDRTRRYETAKDLATDVKRHLHHETIAARPPSTAYRMSRFVRRNRVVVASSVLLTATIFAAAVISIIGWRSAYNRLRSMQELVIERAMLQAVAGELEQLKGTIQHAEDIGVPEDWLLTLQGVSHVHRGENDKAVRLLEGALQQNPDNVSAEAMLSLAYFHNGDWNEFFELIANFENLKPRPEYEEFDSLFIGYGWLYIDLHKSVEQLDDVLNRHPTWYIPRAVLAVALGHASRHPVKDEQLAVRAVEECQVPLQLAGDNPFVLMCCLGASSNAMRVLGCTNDLTQTAYELATALERKHRDYPVASLVRAVFYDQLGESERARDAWMDVLEHGRGAILLWPAAELFRTGHAQRVINLKPDQTEARIARAYVLALTGVDSNRNEARRIFEQLSPKATTWYIRHSLIQIPLLLQDTHTARAVARRWIESHDAAGYDDDQRWEKESLEFLAQMRDVVDFEPGSADPSERFFANYQLGLIAYSDGDKELAKRHFAACPFEALKSGSLKWWARAFVEHLSGSISHTDLKRGSTRSHVENASDGQSSSR